MAPQFRCYGGSLAELLNNFEYFTMNNLEKYKNDLDRLIQLGVDLLYDLAEKENKDKSSPSMKKRGKPKKSSKVDKKPVSFESDYEKWYSEALETVRQLIPNRLNDFLSLYKREKRKEITYENYTISDYLLGLQITRGGEPVFNPLYPTFTKFQQQVQILQTAQQRFESSLFDIKQLLQADLFDTEIESARELLKKGFVRAAGAVVGVILEKHLSQVCDNHNIKVPTKKTSISAYNDLLKNNDIIDVVNWRFIQRLGDIRNLCDHNKIREPSEIEVEELIDGVEKIIKTLY